MRRARRYPRLCALLTVAVAEAACGGNHPVTARSAAATAAPTSVSTIPATTTSSAVATTATLATTTTVSAVPAFSSSETDVTAAQLGASWHRGCPVAPGQLRQLSLAYWGFDGRAHTGALVVNESVAAAVVKVFATLYSDRFPIREMVPQSGYGGDDNSAAAADDTSGFNCRYAVAPGPPQWSVHAYGEAIDVNDVQNPYIDGSTVIPPAGAAYENRADARPGMAVYGGALVDAFASVGWQWGGRWVSSPDYQHFSSTGG